jgi:hypothetical protein
LMSYILGLVVLGGGRKTETNTPESPSCHRLWGCVRGRIFQVEVVAVFVMWPPMRVGWVGPQAVEVFLFKIVVDKSNKIK